MDVDRLEIRKQRARAWFETLRDRIVAAFEELEDALPAHPPQGTSPAGRFAAHPGTARPQRRAGRGRRHGDDEGRVFEKVGVHASTV